MGWWNGKEELFENNEIPYNKCSECSDYKEVSKKYINKISDEMITICYDCSKKRYIESLIVVSACLLYTSPSPRDGQISRMPSSA